MREQRIEKPRDVEKPVGKDQRDKERKRDVDRIFE